MPPLIGDFALAFKRLCPEIGAPGYDPFGPMSTSLNLLIGAAALDPVSGTASHRSYLCEIRAMV